MKFVQSAMLGALAALAIPIIVHLLFRRRSRPVDLGTLQFLKIVLRDNARKRRLKRYVLLALRMAGVALIALLFARPYLIANEPVDGRRLVIVLVDRSASMGLNEGGRPIDRAAREVRSIIGRAGKGTQVEVAAFDTAVDPFPSPDEAARARLEPAATGTDYAAALAWARDLAIRSPARAKELHILTDLQRSGLDRGESVTIPADVEVHLTDLGAAFPKNVGVTALALTPPDPRPGASVTVSAVVRNASPLPLARIPVRLHLEAEGNDPIDRDDLIDLEGATSQTVTFELPDLEEGLWTGRVEAEAGDGLAFDDRRYLALNVAPPMRLLLADGQGGRSPIESETYFLRAALALAPEGETYARAPFAPTEMGPNDDFPDHSGYGAVVLANVANLSGADAERLAEFVRNGGGLLVFTGDRVGPESTSALDAAGLTVGHVVGPRPAAGRPWRLESWDAKHPIFRPFADPEYGDLRRPMFTTITAIEPDPAARVLARFRDGVPAVIEKPQGRGKVVWFASACDRDWGDWPRGRLFLPMVHQLVAYASGLTEGGRVRPEPASPRTPPGLVRDGTIVRVVNADPFETETARVTPQEFADRFAFKLPEPTRPVDSPAPEQMATDDRIRPDEIWPWLALALVGIMLIETFLANRTAA